MIEKKTHDVLFCVLSEEGSIVLKGTKEEAEQFIAYQVSETRLEKFGVMMVVPLAYSVEVNAATNTDLDGEFSEVVVTINDE